MFRVTAARTVVRGLDYVYRPASLGASFSHVPSSVSASSFMALRWLSHDVHVARDEKHDEPFAPGWTADATYATDATASRIRSELAEIKGESQNNEVSVNPDNSSLWPYVNWYFRKNQLRSQPLGYSLRLKLHVRYKPFPSSQY